MKLGLILLAELAEGARDWSLVNNHKARSLVVTGGRKIPKVSLYFNPWEPHPNS